MNNDAEMDVRHPAPLILGARVRRVVQGDTVAIVSPSSPGIAQWPHRVQRAQAYLESLGLNVRIMPHAGGRQRWVSAAPLQRADDINEAFADPDIAVVLCSVGGNHSTQVLPHLDLELIRGNPKVFQGYSDATILHLLLFFKCGLRTFYGPSFVIELAEYPGVLAYTDASLRLAWFGASSLRFSSSAIWTDEFLDFDKKLDVSRARVVRDSEGWHALRSGVAEGPLVGGCLSTIAAHAVRSELWPDLTGAVLLLETPPLCPPPMVDAHLTELARVGTFDQIAGLLVARPYGYSADEVTIFKGLLEQYTARREIPVLADVDCGHTDPMITLPLGSPVRIDTDRQQVEVLDVCTVAS